MTAATQLLEALDDETRAAVRGTARTHACFRLGGDDAKLVAPSLNREHQAFNPEALQNLERGVAVLRRPGHEACEVEIPAPVRGMGNPASVIKQSRLHYGVRRAKVEANILRALGIDG